MRKLLVVLTMVALPIGVALAAVTWHDGPHFSFNGTTATASGDGSGLGTKKPAVATIVITQIATYTCQNNGGNTAQGQNQVTSVSSGNQDLGNTDHNGRGVFDFSVTVQPPATTVAGTVAGCPNSKNSQWTGVNPQVVSGPTATLTITQGSSTIFGPVSCTASSGPCPF
jgi:hypothetical protein